MMKAAEKMVPELRFKEFEGEWNEKRTKEIAPLQRGFDLPTTEVVNGLYPVVYSNGVLRKHIEYKVKGPGIVTGRSGTIGKITYVKENFWPHNTSLWVTSFQGNDPKFIYYFYRNFNLSRYNAGSTVPTLNRNDVHSIKKRIPSLPEQQKIANFLSAVDQKIQQLQRKKELLVQYKKGMMQKLFSQQIRFKNEQGNEFPDWEVRSFKEVADFINGKAFKQIELLSRGKYPVLRVGNLFSNNEWYFSDLELDDNKYIENGDLIYAWSATFGPRFWNGDKAIYHYHIWKVLPNGKVNKLYLYWAFEYDVERIKSQSQGGTMFHITKGNIESRKFLFPTILEQQKIANFLSSLDEKVAQVGQQISQAQRFKKGLLQKMFV